MARASGTVHVKAHQNELAQQGGQHVHCIGLGQMRFEAEEWCGGKQKCADQRCGWPKQRQADQIGDDYRQHCGGEGGEAIVADFRNGIRPGGDDDTGLQPVDADRFLVARFLTQTRRDVIATFHHLPGRLCEAGLVAVYRRDCEQARQKGQQADQNEERHGNPPRWQGALAGDGLCLFLHHRYVLIGRQCRPHPCGRP